MPYTRITEFRHMTGQAGLEKSTLAYEYPRSEGPPYYPIPNDEARAQYKRYEELADALPDVTFVGRLARYQYLNMDQVVGQALALFNRIAQAEQPGDPLTQAAQEFRAADTNANARTQRVAGLGD